MKLREREIRYIIKDEIKKIISEQTNPLEEPEEEPEEETEEDEEETEEDEEYYDEDYEEALSKIARSEERIEYLTKRLEHCLEKEKVTKAKKDMSYKGWTSLWEEK